MTKLLKTIALISLGAAAGCNTMEGAKPAMVALKGKPISAAVEKLGYPDDQISVGNEKVYTWANSSSGSYTVPTTSTTTTWVNGTPIYGTTRGLQEESYSMSCKFKIITTQSDIIEHFQWDGNIGACGVYAMRLTKKD